MKTMKTIFGELDGCSLGKDLHRLEGAVAGLKSIDLKAQMRPEIKAKILDAMDEVETLTAELKMKALKLVQPVPIKEISPLDLIQ